MTTANFGNESTAFNLSSFSANRIKAYRFICPDNGTALKITVALKRSNVSGSNKWKCAIYNDDLSLLGVTEERILNLTFAFTWYIFNFVGIVNLVAGNFYRLAVWRDGINVRYISEDTGVPNQRVYQDIVYDGFPNPLIPSSYLATTSSIYCTYEIMPTITINPKRIIELCPNCGSHLKQTMYSSRDPFDRTKRIFRCGNCYAQLVFDYDVNEWVRVEGFSS